MSVMVTRPPVAARLPTCRPRPPFGGTFCGMKSLLHARHAVVVGPAIDDRQLLAEVAVRRRRVRRLPLQRGGVPRVAAGRPAAEVAADQVVEEQHLRGADDQRGERDSHVQRVRRFGMKFVPPIA